MLHWCLLAPFKKIFEFAFINQGAKLVYSNKISIILVD